MIGFLPYPLRAAKPSISCAFACWWPELVRPALTEQVKQAGAKIWWFRFLCFQIEYSRWV